MDMVCSIPHVNQCPNTITWARGSAWSFFILKKVTICRSQVTIWSISLPKELSAEVKVYYIHQGTQCPLHLSHCIPCKNLYYGLAIKSNKNPVCPVQDTGCTFITMGKRLVKPCEWALTKLCWRCNPLKPTLPRPQFSISVHKWWISSS